MAGLFSKNKLREIAKAIETSNIEDSIGIVRKWQNDYHSGTLKTDKETTREQSYNQDIFIRVLGYCESPNDPYSFRPKDSTGFGQFPDAVIGRFGQGENKAISAVIELKGAYIELDRPQRRENNMSPVKQGFNYKTQYKECPFVIISNFWEFRLYNNNQIDYEAWTLDDLCNPDDDYVRFKTWYTLLCKENFLPDNGKSKTERLLSDVRREQEEIGNEFYKEYYDIRLDLIKDLYKRNNAKDINIDCVINKAQKIMDRIVFCCFAEDRGLLPDDIIERIITSVRNSPFSRSLWKVFKEFFSAISIGDTNLGIPNGYNGGLFSEDAELDNLDVGDDVLTKVASLSKYSFEEQLSVTILGHIFEQSIDDLEELRISLSKTANMTTQVIASLPQRKLEGIYYTPDYIVDHMVKNTLLSLLEEQEENFKKQYRLKEGISDSTYEKREQDAYYKYQEFLKGIKIIDPACGSGAFLVHIFDCLLAENLKVASILKEDLFSNEKYIRSILTNNIFGVDVNEASVEITKLSLWLKSAYKGQKLTSLDNNIKCGNSLINDTAVAGNKAFIWEEEFMDIISSGGFDIVVMNPPYIDSESMTKNVPEQRNHIAEKYSAASGNWDIYVPFIQKAMLLTKEGGFCSFITPDKWVVKPFGEELRKLILPYVVEVVKAGRSVFKDSKVDAIITTLKKLTSTNFHTSILENGHFNKLNIVSKPTIRKPYAFNEYFTDPNKLSIVLKMNQRDDRLRDVAVCENACATSNAYKLAALIHENEYPSSTELKVINTGTISKYSDCWGVIPMTYFKKAAGKKYKYPVVDKQKFCSNIGGSYYKKATKSKLIIKGLTLLDACIDLNAEIIPGKSTLVICHDNVETLYQLMAFLNSKAPYFYIRQKYSFASYNGGINFTPEMINDIPMPKISDIDTSKIISLSRDLKCYSAELMQKEQLFKQVIMSGYKMANWPKALEVWWDLEIGDFLRAFRKLNSRQKSDLASFYNDKRSGFITLRNSIKLAEEEINNIIYKGFELFPNEIALIT